MNTELTELLNAIRECDFPKFEALLNTDAGMRIISTPSDMNESDISRLIKKSKLTRQTLVPSATRGCTPLFFTLLYGNFKFFEQLVRKGALVTHKTSGGIDLFTFSFGCSSISRITDLIMTSAPAVIAASMDSPLNPYISHRSDTTTMATHSRSESFYDEFDTLYEAAKEENLTILQECIQIGTHLKDSEGFSLGIAISQGKEKSVRALKAAGMKITPRHFFISGYVGYREGDRFYHMINLPRPPTSIQRAEIPDCVTSGDLFSLNQNLKNNPPSAYEKGRWLYAALTSKQLLASRLLIENNLEIEPKHFYAAGRIHQNNDRNSEILSKRFYEFLSTLHSKQPLPASFYTEEENRIYSGIEERTTNKNNRSFV